MSKVAENTNIIMSLSSILVHAFRWIQQPSRFRHMRNEAWFVIRHNESGEPSLSQVFRNLPQDEQPGFTFAGPSCALVGSSLNVIGQNSNSPRPQIITRLDTLNQAQGWKQQQFSTPNHHSPTSTAEPIPNRTHAVLNGILYSCDTCGDTNPFISLSAYDMSRGWRCLFGISIMKPKNLHLRCGSVSLVAIADFHLCLLWVKANRVRSKKNVLCYTKIVVSVDPSRATHAFSEDKFLEIEANGLLSCLPTSLSMLTRIHSSLSYSGCMINSFRFQFNPNRLHRSWISPSLRLFWTDIAEYQDL